MGEGELKRNPAWPGNMISAARIRGGSVGEELMKAMSLSDCEALPDDLEKDEAFLFDGVLGRLCGMKSGASALNGEGRLVLRGSEPDRTSRPRTLRLLDL